MRHDVTPQHPPFITNEEESELERISKLNLIQVYREELMKIRMGVNPHELMIESTCERLRRLGILSYSRIRRVWLLSQDSLFELEKLHRNPKR